jgi:predicted ArsR family transcriptional regulator
VERWVKRDWAMWFASEGVPIVMLHGVTANGQCTCGVKNDRKHKAGKHPLRGWGPRRPTTDVERIKEAFRVYPDANYGYLTASKVLVIDIDAALGGWDSMAELQAEHGPFAPSFRVLTGAADSQGRRGEHWLFANPGDVGNPKLVSGGGIDVKGGYYNGQRELVKPGYVVGPYSRHQSGRLYEPDGTWRDLDHLAPLPDWLHERLRDAPVLDDADSFPDEEEGSSAAVAALPHSVLRRLGEDSSTQGERRSGQLYSLVAKSMEEGCTRALVRRAAWTHRPSREKFGNDKERFDKDVERIIAKVARAHGHAGKMCAEVECPNRRAPEPDAMFVETIAEIRSWVETSWWGGAGGARRKSIMLQFLEVAEGKVSLRVHMAQLDLCRENSVWAPKTIRRDLKRLETGDERRLRVVRRGRGRRATLYELLPPSRSVASRNVPIPNHDRSSTRAVVMYWDFSRKNETYRDLLFRGGLGHSGFAILTELAARPDATTALLAAETGLSYSAAWTSLGRLFKHGIVERSGRGTSRNPYVWTLVEEPALTYALDKAAKTLGVEGESARLAARIADQRRAWADLAARREREYAPHPAIEDALRNAMQWGVGEDGEDGEEGEESAYFRPQTTVRVVDRVTGEVLGTVAAA